MAGTRSDVKAFNHDQGDSAAVGLAAAAILVVLAAFSSLTVSARTSERPAISLS